ncbi:MAG: CHAT domain-containing protein [Caldilineaceae bacterium]|nr:CHAT domain-containing protein [Caldilineaceae bacterium]
MQPTQTLPNLELLALLQSADDAQLRQAIQTYHFTIETVQQLKDYSAEFHFTDSKRALEIAQTAHRLGEHLSLPAAALGAWALGNAYLHNAQYKDADRLFVQARNLYRADNNQLDAARMSVGHVGMLAYNGKIDEALTLSAEIRPILTVASRTNKIDQQRLGKLLMNTGVAHELLGEYEEALMLYEQQKTIAEALDDQFMLAQLANNRAYALAQIGSYAEAIHAYQTAEARFAALDTPHDMIRLYYNHASLLTLLKRYTEARALQEKAAQLLHHLEEAELQRHWLRLMWELLNLQAQWPITDAAFPQLYQAKQAFAEHGPLFAVGLTWLILGLCHLHRQAWQEAHSAFQSAHTHAKRHGDQTLEYRVYAGLGELATAQQQHTDAIHAYTNAIQVIERIRKEFRIETIRADFLTDKLTVYQKLAHLYGQTEQLEMAFHVVERAKARLITEKLNFRLQQEAAALTLPDDQPLQQLNVQLQRKLATLNRLYKQLPSSDPYNANEVSDLEPDAGVSDDEMTPPTSREDTVAKVEQEIQSLIYQIQYQRPVFSVYATGEPAPLGRLQQRLAGKRLLQYYIHDQEVWVFVVGEKGILAHMSLASLPEVEESRQRLTTSIERTLGMAAMVGIHKMVRHFPMLLAESQQHLHRLYQQLLKPLLSFLATDNDLIIVPDQILHYIPFHALFDGQHYVLETQTISYAPSATILDLCLAAMPQGDGVLLCGYDNQELAAVATELQMIQQIMPSAEIHLGDACRTEIILQPAAQYRILHLAAHAKFRMDQPLLSSLTFADRNLTLLEIAHLELTADLVTLSGCETGHGQLHGTDLLSLASGFLSAGARSLVVSLWRVEDLITAQLMTAFYRALINHASRAEALRSAQLAILRPDAQTPIQTVYTHPAFWAPFTLIGNWQPLQNFSQFSANDRR